MNIYGTDSSETTAQKTSYDNNISGLTAMNVQDAIDQIVDGELPIEAKNILISDPDPSITLKTYDSIGIDTVNGFVSFTDSNDLEASKLGMIGSSGTFALTNYSPTGQVIISADSKGMTINPVANKTTFSTSVEVSAGSGSDGTFIIKDNAADIGSIENGINIVNQSGALGAALSLTNGSLILSNENTDGIVGLSVDGQSLIVDSLEEKASVSTKLDAPSYLEDGKEGFLVRKGPNFANLVCGTNSGDSLSGVNGVTAIGYQSMVDNVTGRISAFGSNAAEHQLGTSNSAFGLEAMKGNVNVPGTGIQNTAIGHQSLLQLEDGSNNTAIGHRSGKTVSSGDDNVFVGYSTGDGLTGSQNVFIGSGSTSSGAVAGTNMIGIGYGVETITANECVIGNSGNEVIRGMGNASTDLGSSTFPFKTAYVKSISGTTSIPSQDFPDTAADYTTPGGYVISESSLNSGNVLGWKAFDRDTTTNWSCDDDYVQSGSGVVIGPNSTDGWTSEWLQVVSPLPLILQSYDITASINQTATPKLFRIYGSNDGVSWTQIDERTNETGWNQFETRSYTLASTPDPYTHYRLAIQENEGFTVIRVVELLLTATEDCPTPLFLDIPTCVSTGGNLTVANRVTSDSINTSEITCNSLRFPKPFGEMFFQENTTSMSITAANTYYTVLGKAVTANPNNTLFTTDSVNNTLTYTGTHSLLFHAGASFSFAGVTNADIDWVFSLCINETENPGSRALRQTTTSGVYGSTAIHSMMKLNTNDVVTLRVKNTTNTDNIIVSDINVFLIALPNSV